MYLLSFKKFLNEDYFHGLEDELNINWEDIVKVYENEPWVLTNINLGKEIFKAGDFQIVPGTLTKDGADVIIKSKTRSYLPGKRVANDTLNKKVYRLNREQLLKMLTRGWMPE